MIKTNLKKEFMRGEKESPSHLLIINSNIIIKTLWRERKRFKSLFGRLDRNKNRNGFDDLIC